jgi:hypothetical protein
MALVNAVVLLCRYGQATCKIISSTERRYDGNIRPRYVRMCVHSHNKPRYSTATVAAARITPFNPIPTRTLQVPRKLPCAFTPAATNLFESVQAPEAQRAVLARRKEQPRPTVALNRPDSVPTVCGRRRANIHHINSERARCRWSSR